MKALFMILIFAIVLAPVIIGAREEDCKIKK